MKKKTLVKVLPALLITPVLALCITGFAMASNYQGESYFEKLINNFIQNSEYAISLDEKNTLANIVPNDSEFYDDSETFAVNTHFETIEGATEEVAYISGKGDNFSNAIDENGTLTIPIYIYHTDGGITNQYKVVGISNENGGLTPNLSIKGKLRTLVINGWERNSEGNIEGGWFKSIASNTIQNYYSSKTPDQYGNDIYSGSVFATVVFPDCLKSIGAGAFQNDAMLSTIQTQNNDLSVVNGFPTNLTKIGNKSFCDCTVLGANGLTIDGGITLIDYNAFWHCVGLTSLSFGDNVTTIAKNAFEYCTSLETLTLGKNIKDTGSDDDKTYGLGDACFNCCINLKTIYVGESMQSLHNNCFSNCTSLENVDYSNAKSLKTIGDGVFRNNTNLQSVVIPSTVEKIGKEAFASCYNINNIAFSEGLQEIDQYAFANLTENPSATGLNPTPSKIQYIKLPDSLEIIQPGAFLNSAKLIEVVVGMKNSRDSYIYSYAFANCPKLISLSFVWNMPRLIHTQTFINDPTYGKCNNTPSLELRVRPLIEDSQFGNRIENFWLKPFWDEVRLDEILPSGSRICLLAAFDDAEHGNDLEMYLEKTYHSQTSGAIEYLFDDQTIDSWNVGLQNEVKYRTGISIPDTLTLRNDHTADEKMIQTITEAGNSKTIEFVWDSTPITQTIINSEGERETITRPEDDGVLDIGNNCIQTGDPSKQAPEGRNVTLNVGFRILHEGSYEDFDKSPLITGHFIPSERLNETNVAGPVQFNSISNAYEEGPVGRCPLDYTEPERQSANLLQSNSATWPTYDITAFSNKSGCVLNFNMPKSTTPSTDKEKNLDFVVFDNNIAWNSCVYNSGKLDMENCKFTNNKGAWGNRRDQYATTDPWGGSCIFNNGSPAYKGKTDIEGGATLKHCVMEGNSSIVRGGSIYNVGDITLNDCGIKASKSTGDCINEDGTKTGQKCAHPNYAFAGAIYSNIGGKGYEGLMGNLIFEGSWVEESTAYAYVGGIYTRNGAHLEMKDIQLDDGTTSVCHYSDNLEGNLGKNPIEEPMAEEDKCYSDIGLGPDLNTKKLVPFIMTNSSGGGMGGNRTSYVRAMCDLVPGQENIICTTTGISSTDGWAINKITAGEDKWELNVDAEGRLVFKPKTSATNKQSFIQKIQSGFEANKETIKEKLNDNAEFLQKEAYIR